MGLVVEEHFKNFVIWSAPPSYAGNTSEKRTIFNNVLY